MPATITPITGRREAQYVVLEIAVPGHAAQPCGVLLIDPTTDRGWVRMRPEFSQLTDDTEVLDALEDDLRAKLAEGGAQALLSSLEESLSNAVRISERRSVTVDAFTRALERLYSENVETVAVAPFRTHLPLYSLRAAAGKLGDEMEVEPEDWVPAPHGMPRSEEHTSELQSRENLVCRL